MTEPREPPLVVGVTGASGAAYAVRLLRVLLAAGRDVHAVFSPAAVQVFRDELHTDLSPVTLDVEALFTMRFPWSDRPLEPVPEGCGALTVHRHVDWSAGPASGSFRTGGMVICPCSMGTLASVAGGLCSNLIHRAAAVHLKERRKLIVVPRETPLSAIHLGNMQTVAAAGAVLLPAMPGFYHGVNGVDDLVDFVVARIVDQLGIDRDLMTRWGT
ncbi:UbiX family flavin prenyltransferase [Alienimonas californiensis]|uniref:Flavin prenyltransferase UbiX n=1 Tax=Alienimonas californiensis TaxID=2527989 RepID=A0A517PFN8_9PLAN|nr:flavin prenyltransferase UbiX [Alienimonas californiensis]QDT18196.1 putative aromatic acid decarboxylase [Alienimonas californiensis]